MGTVSSVSRTAKQPYGGYIKPSDLMIRRFPTRELHDTENLHPSIVGMAVDYLVRLHISELNTYDDFLRIFEPAINGAFVAKKLGRLNDAEDILDSLLQDVLSDRRTSIIAACKLSSFDVWYRNPAEAMKSTKTYKDILPDDDTIDNINEMYLRGAVFFHDFERAVTTGFKFSPSAFTRKVTNAECDYITKDGIWDMKVSNSKPTNKHTLQLLMYWIMSKHTYQKEVSGITKTGIFNPRLNMSFSYDMNNISKETIQEIERNIIGYDTFPL